MSEKFTKYLNSIRFFSAKIDLVKNLAENIDSKKHENIQEMYENGEIEVVPPVKLKLTNKMRLMQKGRSKNSSQPTARMLASGGAAPAFYKTEERKQEKLPLEIAKLKKKTDFRKLGLFISEQIYYFLHFLSEEDEAIKGKPLNIHSTILPEMSEILGLPEEDVMLNNLVNDFEIWLKEKGEVKTLWGEILYAEGGNMYLKYCE